MKREGGRREKGGGRREGRREGRIEGGGMERDL